MSLRPRRLDFCLGSLAAAWSIYAIMLLVILKLRQTVGRQSEITGTRPWKPAEIRRQFVHDGSYSIYDFFSPSDFHANLAGCPTFGSLLLRRTFLRFPCLRVHLQRGGLHYDQLELSEVIFEAPGSNGGEFTRL